MVHFRLPAKCVGTSYVRRIEDINSRASRVIQLMSLSPMCVSRSRHCPTVGLSLPWYHNVMASTYIHSSNIKENIMCSYYVCTCIIFITSSASLVASENSAYYNIKLLIVIILEDTWRSELLCRIEVLAKSCSIPSEVCIFSIMLYIYMYV